MNRTHTLPYDDTPTGHTYAAAWWTLTGFGVLSALLIMALTGEAAIYKIFG
jgi:hypothetical protein